MAHERGTTATAAVTAAAAAILATVYIAEYGFGLLPCGLCFGQRVPYFAVVLLGALSLMPAMDARSRRVVLFHLAGLFVIGAGMGIFHAGVEYHWWAGPDTCTGRTGAISVDDMMSALGQRGGPMCDEPAFVLFGLSLAGFNALAAAALAAFSVFAGTCKTWWTA